MNFIILFNQNYFARYERHRTSIFIVILLIENIDKSKIEKIDFYTHLFFLNYNDKKKT